MTRTKQISNKALGKAPANESTTKRKYKQATNILRQIRKEQMCTDLLLKKKPFYERARAVATAINGGQPLQWTSKALEQLLEAGQQRLTERFQDANEQRVHRGKKTLIAKDMAIARRQAKLACDAPKELVLPRLKK